MSRSEDHFTHRTGWVRAEVPGANNGIRSTAVLCVFVVANETSHGNERLPGVATLAVKVMAMAAGIALVFG